METNRPPAPPAPPPNTQLGRYILVDRIAVGGMAEVFRALEPRDVGEPRMVVLKRMLPHIAAEQGARAMFEEEARLGSQIVHPNVVHVIDHGEIEDKPFLTLEYVPGCDLWKLNRWLIRQGIQLSHDLVVYVVRQLLSGLQSVHNAEDAQGNPMHIVHRDISPSNLIVSIHGEVKLIDFGIARAHLKNDEADAPRDRAKGKLGYLAPEQVAGSEVDAAADLFSVGVIAAELLMRRPLFSGGSELAVLLAIRDAQIHPFIEIIPTLPDGLGEVICEALSVDSNDRPQDAVSFSNTLKPFQRSSDGQMRGDLASLVQRLVDEQMPERRSSSVNDLQMPTLPPDDWGEFLPDHPPNTADVNPIDYRLRFNNGTIRGPLTYAELVEMIATGRVNAADKVQIADGEFQPISALPDLCRHVPAAMATPTTGQIMVDPGAAYLYLMEEGGMVRAFATTFVQKQTGLWLCEQGGIRKEVYTQNGVPTFVTSNLASELLGEHLVKREVITRSELDMALAVMPRFEGKLGDTLVALGLVEPLMLFQHIEDQVREKLLDLFTWITGTATFYGDVAPPVSGFPLRLDPWQILDAGLQRRIAAGLEDELILKSGDRSIVQVKRLPTAIATANFPVFLTSTLQATATEQTLDELVRQAANNAPEDAQRGYRDVAILLALGALQWVTP